MNMKITAMVGGAVLVFATSVAFAGKPVQPPTTAKVGGLEVFSAGTSIGYLLTLFQGVADTIGTKGYGFSVHVNDGHLQSRGLYFEGTNCAGQAYAASYLGSSDEWVERQGWVFRTKLGSLVDDAYYIPRHSEQIEINFASAYQNDMCYNTSGTLWVVPAYPNDTAITGVPNGPFAQPIVFGIP